MKKGLLLLLLLWVAGTLVNAQEAEWSGKWIQASDCMNQENTWQVFRKTVKIESVPEVLVAKISVDSKYWLWVNGMLIVFEGGIKRGPTPTDSYYDEVDIAPYLREGDNIIGVLTLFYGKEGFSHKNSGLGALLFDAKSPEINILSDESWEAAVYKAYGKTGEPSPNYRLPECNIKFDGRLDLGDWYAPANQIHFPNAKVVSMAAENEIFGKLVPRPIPMFKNFGLKEYEQQTFDEKTRILHCKMPYNAQVTPYLKVEAKAGLTIDMRTENYLIGGSVPSIRAEYVTRDSIQEYESLGWMNGNEVQYTIPEGVKVLAVKYRETGYDTEIVGNFHCNDSFFNELWKRSARTLYVNMRDSYFDCPDRERAQWWGDVTNDIQENFYTLSPTSWQIITKGIYELMNWQREDGTLFAPIPAGNWDKELPVQMLMSIGWYGFYTQYYYSADSSFVAPVYDRMHKYLHDVWEFDSDGFVIPREGGWSWADWGDHVDLTLLTNEWYYLALKCEKEFARQLNKTDDVVAIDNMMKTMEKNFKKRFWKKNCYRSADYTEAEPDDRAQAIAVLSGLAEKDKYPALLKIFKTVQFASPLMEMYVQQALFQMGEGKFALERAKSRYEKMMSYPDETTLFEFWDKGGSINHAWTSGMTVIFGRNVCGVRPTSPGFKTFEVKPDLAGLTEVSANMETKYGFIKVALKKIGNQLNVVLTVPNNTQAKVIVGEVTMSLEAGTHSLSFKE